MKGYNISLCTMLCWNFEAINLHKNGTLKITGLCFLKVWNDRLIFKTLNVVVFLLCLTDDNAQEMQRSELQEQQKKLAPNSLPLHANTFFSLIVQQSKKKSIEYENQRDSPWLSLGKYKCISNGADSCDLFNYDNPSKKIKTIF